MRNNTILYCKSTIKTDKKQLSRKFFESNRTLRAPIFYHEVFLFF